VQFLEPTWIVMGSNHPFVVVILNPEDRRTRDIEPSASWRCLQEGSFVVPAELPS
jgi:hypothetical protein